MSVSDKIALADRQNRFDGLAANLASEIAGEQARHEDWVQFGLRWAELTTLRMTLGSELSEEQIERYACTRGAVDEVFGRWLQSRYAGPHNQPADPPVMLHHVPRTIARYIGEEESSKQQPW